MLLLLVSSSAALTLLFLTAVLSTAPRLSYATHPRRILHQPFFPDDSIPPSHPPSPSKIPFSETTPDNGTFFPSSPIPPPPPSPSAFASFPANISSLILPQSPGPNRNSKNALIAGLSSSFCVLLILGIFVFFHRRRKTRNKTHSAEKPRPDPSTAPSSSEFLYMGTSRNTSSPDPRSYRIKPNSQSPELHPLPPLNPTRNPTDTETETESPGDEEFYSPRGSLGGGRESSTTGTETGSMRVYTVYVLPSDETTSSQYSSSNSGSGSPDRSSISPPVSLSPLPKSPALLPLPPPNIRPLDGITPSSGATSPNREIEGTEQLITEEDDLSTKISTSPERDFNKNNIISEGNYTPPSSSSSEKLNPPPPPPPPPLPPLVRKMRLDSPVASTPTGQPIISRPPELIAPSRPFVVEATETEVSPMELPPAGSESANPKPRLKPLHWDKVRASSDREMVWDHLGSSSFKLNEEMIETLFVANTRNPETSPGLVIPTASQESRVLDPKKAQNVSILLRALNVTIEDVCESLSEGNAENLGSELFESLLKMAPTKEEERKLKDYKDDSPSKLDHAEKFLKAVLDVPFAFKRVEAMLYIANFDSEVEYLKKSFGTLEAACEELRNSRMFLKLLEAVLKTGNRMNVGTNRGDAHAFKLDTLLKLVDVKGADGKTTLLHFVVQEIIRTEGARVSSTNQDPSCSANEDAKCRKLGLQVVSGLSSELANVKKAAGMDSDVLIRDVSKLSRGVQDICELIRLIETHELDSSSQKFSESMKKFMKMAEEQIIRIQAQESVSLSLVKEITEYFHGNSAKEEAHPFRIFMVVRDFLGILDRVCKEVGLINERTMVPSAHKFPVPVNPTLPQAFPGHNIVRQYSSSDDESLSSW